MSRIVLVLFLALPLFVAACSDPTVDLARNDLLRPTEGAVSGVILDRMTEEPLPFTVIQVVDTTNDTIERQVQSNSLGEFETALIRSPEEYRLQAFHGGRFETGFELATLPMYRFDDVRIQDSWVEVRAEPRALLVLDLLPDRPLRAEDRLEIRVNGTDPLRYTGATAPERKFVGVPAGNASVSWTVYREGESPRTSEASIDCERFGTAQHGIEF